MALALGDLAPDFTLPNQDNESVTLSSFRGVSPVTLVFVPLAFSGTCTGEFCELTENLSLFDDAGVRLFGISVDSRWSLHAWREKEGYTFDLLADFWPHGAVASEYGVFDDLMGFAVRGTFVIDVEGRIAASFVNGPGERRPLSNYREALARL